MSIWRESPKGKDWEYLFWQVPLFLFNIYINDVKYSVPNMALRLYADDTTGYNSDHGFVFSSTVHGQYNLSALSTWFEQNLLLVNKAKTQAIEF